jgi:vancomycin aglycone glucosyltransferase
MRVLLSTIGSRGDVQPLVALALHLKTLGHAVRLCVPPDFREWIESFGIAVTPIGPEIKKFAAKARGPADAPSPEQLRQMMEATIATQFETIGAAASDCDVIVAATALQIAARSVAEKKGIPYFFAAYSATVLPSLHHSPPPLPGEAPGLLRASAPEREGRPANQQLWEQDAARFNDHFRPALNAHRVSLGLAPVDDVRSYMFTDRPWLAADPTLGPWPDVDDGVFQTGAWILEDDRPLSSELRMFLDGGEPPIYFGFGSTAATRDEGQVMMQTARALGRRAIVSRGWFDLALIDHQPDCLSIGDANLHALFPRVAAIVHHGGAGTTTAAALAGTPQVVVPHRYDQHYWAARVAALGLGVAHAPITLTAESLTEALERSLQREVVVRAVSVAGSVRRDGVRVAAQRIMDLL